RTRVEQALRQPSCLGAEGERIARLVPHLVVARGTARGDCKPSTPHRTQARFERIPDSYRRELRVIHARPAHCLLADIESERTNQMEVRARIRAHADDVAGVRRNFRLEENDVEHANARWSRSDCAWASAALD